MIPIAFVTMVESTIIQLPPVDLAVVIAAGALAVSVYTFFITHTYTSRREQIKTSRYMWERIYGRFDEVQEIANNKGWNKSSQIDIPLKILWPVVREIDYFGYLILIEEISDKDVLDYYKPPLSQYIESILKYYLPASQHYQLYEDYEYFDKLITKWGINRWDEEMP